MRFLTKYVAEFTTFWEEFGMALNMEEAVNIERTQSITAKQKCLHVLQQWKTQSSASYPALLNTLVQLDQTQLALKIEEDILNEISISGSDSEEGTDESEDSDL